MNKVVHLSLARKSTPAYMDVVEQATAPEIDFIIDDYTPPAGATAQIYIKKGDAEVFNTCTIQDNIIHFAPTPGSFDVAGDCVAQLQIINNAEVAVSFRIFVKVEPNLIDGGAIEASDEYGALIDALADVGGIEYRVTKNEKDILKNKNDITDLKEKDLYLQNRLNVAERDINIVDGRVDQIIAGGSVDPDAELVDIRVGADDNTYNSAGDAVRSQYSALVETVKASTVGIGLTPIMNQGSVNPSTGTFNPDDMTRVRTEYIGVRSGLRVFIPDGMKARAFYYDVGALYAEPVTNDFVTRELFILPKHPQVVIAFGYTDDSNITPSDVSSVSFTRFIPSDTTLTLAEKAADSETVGNRFKDVQKVLDKLTTEIVLGEAPWVQGTINNNGVEASSANRCRSTYLVGYDSSAYIRLEIEPGYEVSVQEYSAQIASAANYVQRLVPFTASYVEFVPTTGYMYRLVLRRTDNSNFTPSSIPEGCVKGYVYSIKTTDNEDITFAMNAINILASNGDNEAVDWVQGSLSGTTGLPITAANRVRSQTYLTYNSLRYLYLYCPDGYKMSVRIYEQSDAATLIEALDWKSGMRIIEHTPVTMYKIVLARYDDANITPAEVPSDLLIIPVFNAYWSKSASGESMATRTTKRSNPTYVSQILEVAQSYYDHRNDKTGDLYDMIYGYNSAIRQDTYTREIDCSSFISLVLRGILYPDTQYYTKVDTPASSLVANPDYVWSFNPQYYDYYSADLIDAPNDETRAGQLGEWMIDMGWRIPKDKKLLNLEVGDILFWSRRTASGTAIAQPDRFMSINHVAICIAKMPTVPGDGYYEGGFPYKHALMEVGNATPCVKMRIVERGWDTPSVVNDNNYNTLSLICRPDLGSL